MATDEGSMKNKGSSRVLSTDDAVVRHKRSSEGEETLDDGKRAKLSFGLKKVEANKSPATKTGIQIKLGGLKPAESKIPPVIKNVASIFNNDDDNEEEMPPEAKMRMRNIGRETPTSAGPNSFGKTKQGFCDSKKVFEKTLKAAMEGGASKEKE